MFYYKSGNKWDYKMLHQILIVFDKPFNRSFYIIYLFVIFSKNSQKSKKRTIKRHFEDVIGFNDRRNSYVKEYKLRLLLIGKY